jgi:hypothetical protein
MRLLLGLVLFAAACTDTTASKFIPGEVTVVLKSPEGSASFTSVQIELKRISGSTALDKSVPFTLTSAPLTVNLEVSIDRAFYTTGEPMAMTLRYLSASGSPVFVGGPVTVTVYAK